MMSRLRSFWTDEAGQGLVEYSVLIALITIVLVGVIAPLRESVGAVFTSVTMALTAVLT